MRFLVEGYGYAPDVVGDVVSDLERACKGLNEARLVVGDDFETRFAPIHRGSDGLIALRFAGDFFSERLNERIVFLPKPVSRYPANTPDLVDEDTPLYILGRHLPKAIIHGDAPDNPLSPLERTVLLRLIDRIHQATEAYLASPGANAELVIRSGTGGQCLCAMEFHTIFEAMVDQLLDGSEQTSPPDSPNDEWSKTLPDGHIMDHLFVGPSLTSPTRQVFYVGDSKYYTAGYEPTEDIVAKQYAYARGIVQRNAEHCLAETPSCLPPWEGETPIQLRDNATGGYDIVPNFFISPRMEAPYSFEDDQLTLHDPFHHWQRQVPGRLFDRDTLHIYHFDIDFPTLLSTYARRDPTEMADWRSRIRARIHGEIQAHLQQRYQWFILTPPRRPIPHLRDALSQLFPRRKPLASLTHGLIPEGCALTLDPRAGTLLLALDRLDTTQHEANARLLSALMRSGIHVKPWTMG